MLRPYQFKALEEIRHLYTSGIKKILLHAPTGSGKTVVFAEVLKSVSQKNKTAILVVRGRALVDNASKRLDREGVDHGILMAGHWRIRPRAKIQLCSIDTIYRRKQLPKADILVIDEGHHATSQAYQWLAKAYENSYFLAVTATPYVRGSLRHVASKIVRPTTIKELVHDGFLVPPIYYGGSIPDLTGVKINSTGDYAVDQLDKILNKTPIIGNIVDTWKIRGENRPTIAFAVSIKHSEAIAAAFNLAGIPAISVDAKNSDTERNEAIKRLESGEIKVISNVGIFCTGVDIPALSCLIMARPTKSYALFIQQAGRGTRTFPCKKDFILLDHGGNVLRHGCILEEREGSLDPIPKGGMRQTDGLTTCKSCYAIFDKNVKFCPSCQALNESCSSMAKEKKAENPLDAELEIVNPFHLQVITKRGQLRDIQKRRGYKKGWVYFQLKELFGETVAEQYEPKKEIPDFVREKLRRASKDISRNSPRFGS